MSGQNSNNSVRIPNAFSTRWERDGEWELRRRIDGKVSKTLKARDLWDKDRLGCLDLCGSRHPVRYDDQRVGTCPEDGRITPPIPVRSTCFWTMAQPGVVEPGKFFNEEGEFDLDSFTAVRFACGPWRWRSAC